MLCKNQDNIMTGPKLFEPITVGESVLRNRIVIAPMCQYSAEAGQMNDWHLIHLGQLAMSGSTMMSLKRR